MFSYEFLGRAGDQLQISVPGVMKVWVRETSQCCFRSGYAFSPAALRAANSAGVTYPSELCGRTSL